MLYRHFSILYKFSCGCGFAGKQMSSLGNEHFDQSKKTYRMFKKKNVTMMYMFLFVWSLLFVFAVEKVTEWPRGCCTGQAFWAKTAVRIQCLTEIANGYLSDSFINLQIFLLSYSVWKYQRYLRLWVACKFYTWFLCIYSLPRVFCGWFDFFVLFL